MLMPSPYLTPSTGILYPNPSGSRSRQKRYCSLCTGFACNNSGMSPSPQQSDNLQICGKLLKKRGGFGKFTMSAWQSRCFVVSNNGVLTYYNDSVEDPEAKGMKNPRGRIDLKATDYEFIKDRAIEGAPTTFCMIIQPLNGDEGWKLCASTKEEMAQWCLVFEKYMHEKAPDLATGEVMYASDDEEERAALGLSNISQRQKSKVAIGKGGALKLEVGER